MLILGFKIVIEVAEHSVYLIFLRKEVPHQLPWLLYLLLLCIFLMDALIWRLATVTFAEVTDIQANKTLQSRSS